jgi:hypothetical protein
MKPHLDEARVHFFVQNLYSLNLILLSSKIKYALDYDTIRENLKKYSFLVFKPGLLGLKYRIAYFIFRISSFIYTILLRGYILLVPSEVSVREM